MPKFITMILVVTITGCFYSVDVTNDPDFYAGYRKGQLYETKMDLYIIDDWDNYLLAPGRYSPKLDDYLKSPTKYTDIKGVLKEKSMVQVEKLSYRKTFESSYFDIYARILNGEYKNDIVELSLVSKKIFDLNPKGVFLRKPNPAILELIKDN